MRLAMAPVPPDTQVHAALFVTLVQEAGVATVQSEQYFIVPFDSVPRLAKVSVQTCSVAGQPSVILCAHVLSMPIQLLPVGICKL